MPDRPAVYVHLLPSLIPPGALRGGIAVVVDVLRATTVMVHALAAGCEAIIPCAEIEEAQSIAANLPPGTALLGGERGGLPIAGFDLGNSPGDYTPEVCRGKTLVVTTTNGTRAILASLEAERIYTAAFANLKAVADTVRGELLKRQGRSIHVVCSGTEGFLSLEDSLLAGALTCSILDLSWTRISFEAFPFGNDEAAMTALEWLEAEEHQDNIHARLARILAIGRGGRNVRRIGLEKDIQDAARIDQFDLVPAFDRETGRILVA